MSKNNFYWAVLVIVSLVSIFYTYRYNNDFNSADFLHPVCVEYLDYDKERDFLDIDNLMEKYKFWLFHGDFKKGECPLYPNFEKLTHTSDFDSTVDVPYRIKVARMNGRCVGFVTYYMSENLVVNSDQVKKLGRVHLLCVDEEYRRSGIAKNLVEGAIAFFKEKGCQRVYLVTRPENIRAKALYYKLGFYEMNKNTIENNILDKDPADVLSKEL
jgi:ribosomal protein S18 acetylase RimI-like enzyme